MESTSEDIDRHRRLFFGAAAVAAAAAQLGMIGYAAAQSGDHHERPERVRNARSQGGHHGRLEPVVDCLSYHGLDQLAPAKERCDWFRRLPPSALRRWPP